MQSLRKIILFLFGVLPLGALHAQTTVTLQEALDYALNNSEVIRQARLDIDNASQKVRESKAGAYPQISATSMLTDNPIVQQFVLPTEAFGGAPGEFMKIKAGQTWNAISQVQLSQQLYNQQLFTGFKAARTSVEYYELINKVSEENVIQQVAATFYQVLISQERIKMADANLEQLSKLENVIRGQYESGLAKKIDLDRIKVNKSNMKTEKLSLENDLSQQKNLLKYYMGMPITEEIALQDQQIENSNETLAQLPNGEEVRTEGLYSYRVLKKQDELLGLQREAEKATAYPTLSLDANYVYNSNSDKFNVYSNKALNYDASSIGLTLSIPIFDGNARRSRMKQIEIQRSQVQEEMKRTNNSLQMDLSNARKQLAVSLETVHSQEDNKELAEEVFHSTQNNYKNGLASLTDLLDAETELIKAQDNYNEALLSYKIAEVGLIKAKGKIKSLLEK